MNWNDIFSSRSWGRYPSEELVRFCARTYYPRLAAGEKIRVLELGCGPGANLWYFAREGFAFVGVDGSTEAIALASERLTGECGDSWKTQGGLAVAKFEDLNFAESSFDLVVDIEGTTCVPEDEANSLWKRVSAWLRPDGRVFSLSFADSTERCGFDEHPITRQQGEDRFQDFANLRVDLIARGSTHEWRIVGEKR